MGTGKLLQHAALAGAVSIPLLASGAVLSGADGDEPTASDEQAPCFGCGELYPPGELAPGELETQWCAACIALSAATVWDAGPTNLDPIIVEDDGEP